jgi:hypothetical protein
MVTEYWPTTVRGKEFPDVPKELAAAASQAHLCLSAAAPLGAIAVARAVVEAVAKDHGLATGNLKSKIDSLHFQGHITRCWGCMIFVSQPALLRCAIFAHGGHDRGGRWSDG